MNKNIPKIGQKVCYTKDGVNWKGYISKVDEQKKTALVEFTNTNYLILTFSFSEINLYLINEEDYCHLSPTNSHSDEWYTYYACKYCGEGEDEAKLLYVEIDK
jgi:hypothetical protein